MKIVQNQIKLVILVFALLFVANGHSQNEVKNKKPFVRVFDFEGKKIGKGYVVKVTDSTLELSRNNEYLSLSIKNIDYIKTKRSVGSNALIGSIAGAIMLGVLGASANNDGLISFSPAEGFAFGGVIGGLGGGVIGGITSVFKNSKTVVIEGDKEKWKFFREAINKKTSQ